MCRGWPAACVIGVILFACSDDDAREVKDSGPSDGHISDSAIVQPRDATVDATTIPSDATTSDATTKPGDATTSDATTSDATTMPNCTRVAGWNEPYSAVQVSSLEVLCARFNCASSIADAIALAISTCFRGVLESGCGYTTVRGNWEIHHFETASNKLIGAAFGSDIFFNFDIEGCEAADFQAGRAPGACASRTAIDLCDDAGVDDAGR
jgi:hypothetical protein